MSDWAELVERARATFSLDAVEDDEFAVTLHRDSESGPRRQRVMALRYAAWDRTMVELRSAFGEDGDWDARSLLSMNLTLPLGAVALHGRFLVLVHRACLDDHSVDAVLFLLTQVGLLADVLEQRKGRDRF